MNKLIKDYTEKCLMFAQLDIDLTLANVRANQVERCSRLCSICCTKSGVE